MKGSPRGRQAGERQFSPSNACCSHRCLPQCNTQCSKLGGLGSCLLEEQSVPPTQQLPVPQCMPHPTDRTGHCTSLSQALSISKRLRLVSLIPSKPSQPVHQMLQKSLSLSRLHPLHHRPCLLFLTPAPSPPARASPSRLSGLPPVRRGARPLRLQTLQLPGAVHTARQGHLCCFTVAPTSLSLKVAFHLLAVSKLLEQCLMHSSCSRNICWAGTSI